GPIARAARLRPPGPRIHDVRRDIDADPVGPVRGRYRLLHSRRLYERRLDRRRRNWRRSPGQGAAGVAASNGGGFRLLVTKPAKATVRFTVPDRFPKIVC